MSDNNWVSGRVDLISSVVQKWYVMIPKTRKIFITNGTASSKVDVPFEGCSANGSPYSSQSIILHFIFPKYLIFYDEII